MTANLFKSFSESFSSTINASLGKSLTIPRFKLPAFVSAIGNRMPQ